MTSSTLAPPRPQRQVPAAPSPPPPRATPHPRRSDGYGRVLRWSLLFSLLAHLLLLLLSPAFLRVGLPPGETDEPFDPATAPGMRMVETVLVPDAPAPAETSAAETADRTRVTTPTRDPGVPLRPTSPRPGAPETVPAARGETRDDPLRPGLRDPRLWVTPRRELPPPPEPTQEELHARYMEHLQGRIDALNDSIAGDAERARRATDWTVRDRSGGRWGVSPEGIHLGGVTLPPVRLQGDRDKELAAQERQRQREEIQRQAEEAERRQVREERTRATRERRDAERQPPPES